jgi:hypothetical protein
MIHKLTEYGTFADPYALTVCKTKPNGACKKFKRGSDNKIITEDYSAGWEFEFLVRKVDGFDDLAALLTKVAKSTDHFIMRGSPSESCDLSAARRTMRGDKPDIVDADRAWVMFDYDKGRKDGWPDIVENPEGAAEALIGTLPAAFQEIPFWWQLGNSCGIKENKYSMHLWCLLDRPIPRRTLSAFLHAHGFDRSTATPNLPHYTASPLFISVKDPITTRYGVIKP